MRYLQPKNTRNMESFASILGEVLKYVAPAAAVLIAIRFVYADQAEKDRQTREHMFRAEWLKQLLPLRTAAYERSILFLERLRPEQMLLRIGASGKTADLVHFEILNAIREEYEHNLVQQLYVLPAGWDALVKAKEEVLSMVNQTFRETGPEAEGMAFARLLLEKLSANKSHPCQDAINALKDGFSVWLKS